MPIEKPAFTKKLVHLGLLWLLSGLVYLALGTYYVIESLAAVVSIKNPVAAISWIKPALKFAPIELILPCSIIPIMLIGFYLAKSIGMRLAKKMTLLLMHQKPVQGLFRILLICPMATLGIFALNEVDIVYFLSLALAVAYFNTSFIFIKFNTALEMYFNTDAPTTK